jgi:hypothetical protein
MFLVALLACGPGNVTVSSDAPFCSNWDFDDPVEPTMEIESTSTRITVTRLGVYAACDASFSPDIQPDGDHIAIYEAWDENEGDADCCFSPSVQLDMDRGGKFTIEWFAEGDNTATHSREIDNR